MESASALGVTLLVQERGTSKVLDKVAYRFWSEYSEGLVSSGRQREVLTGLKESF